MSPSELKEVSEEVELGAPPRYARAPNERGAWALSVSGARLSLDEGGGAPSLSLQGWRWYLSAQEGAQALPSTPAPYGACATTQRWVAAADQLWLLTRFSARASLELDPGALVSAVEALLTHPRLSASRGALLITPQLASSLEARGALESFEERGWRPSFKTLNSTPSEGGWVALKRGL